MNAKGVEGDPVVVQSPSPNVGGSTRCHHNLFAFLGTLKQSGGVG